MREYEKQLQLGIKRTIYTRRMTLLYLMLLGTSVISRADGSHAKAGINRFFSDSCRELYASLSEEISRKKPVMRLVGGATGETRDLQSCGELADIPDDIILDALHQDGSAKDATKHAYQSCWIAALLQSGEKTQVSHFDHNRLGNDLYEDFDFQSIHTQVLHQSRPTKSDGPVFVRQLRPFDFVSIGKTRLELHFDVQMEDEDRDGMFQDRHQIVLAPLAAADFDSDGIEDLLINLKHETVSRSRIVNMTLVLSRPKAGGIISPKDEAFYVSKLNSWNRSASSHKKIPDRR